MKSRFFLSCAKGCEQKDKIRWRFRWSFHVFMFMSFIVFHIFVIVLLALGVDVYLPKKYEWLREVFIAGNREFNTTQWGCLANADDSQNFALADEEAARRMFWQPIEKQPAGARAN